MDGAALVNLSNLMAKFRSIDVIANNIANASTPGFKREVAKFEEFLKQMPPSEGEEKPEILSLVADVGVTRDLSQGSINLTGAPYDLAINGSGYFVVQTPQGERYTRNGHFTLDGQGRLVTSGNDVVITESGPVTITPTDGAVSIAPDGTVSSKTATLGKIRIVDFPDPSRLKKEGASLYSSDQVAKPAAGEIRQGAIENSNVEPVIEIAKMIEVMRAYEAASGLMKSLQGEPGEMARLANMPQK
jgi:flagellar basal-body rod protein FlgF